MEWIRRLLGLGLALAGMLVAAAGGTQEPPAEEVQRGDPPRAVAPAPNVGLDRLLQLPDSYGESGQVGEGQVAGASAPEWRTRFAEADQQIADYKKELAEAQRLMEETASGSSQWNLSAPGVQADSSQDSSTGLPLRQRIRRLREEVDEAERNKRTLEVEADLAGVPPEWRK